MKNKTMVQPTAIKMSVLIYFICQVTNMQQVKAAPLSSGACSLKILQDDFNQWHDITEGFLYGFYQNPPDTVNDCTFCNEMGGSIAAI